MNSLLSSRNLKFILIAILIYSPWRATYAQDDHLTVQGNTKTDTLTFTGDRTAYPATPVKGELFYHENLNQVRYCDGTIPTQNCWQVPGQGPKHVASRIVAALNTPNGANRSHRVCGATNNQVTIQQALGDIAATGGAVYLLEGTYDISGPINLGANQTLIGTGKGTVLKVHQGSNGLWVINAANVSGILVSQLMLDGNNQTGANNRGINFNTVTSSNIEKVWIENIRGSGISLVSSSGNSIVYSHITNNSANGITISSSNNNNIGANHLKSNSNGISAANSTNNIFSDNQIQNSALNGISFSLSEHNIFSSNKIIENKNYGVYLNNCDYNNFSDNEIGTSSWDGVCLENGADYNVIFGNNVMNNSHRGMYLISSFNNNVTSNMLFDNGVGTNYDGIRLDSASLNLISSNRIFNSNGSGYGINLSNSVCSNNYLAGNSISGPGYTGRLMRDSGAGTQYTDKSKITLEPLEINIGSSPYVLDIVTSPRTYVHLNPSLAITLNLVSGQPGDLLILENITNIPVTINDNGMFGMVNLAQQPRILGRYDTLTLIRSSSSWLEVEFVDN